MKPALEINVLVIWRFLPYEASVVMMLYYMRKINGNAINVVALLVPLVEQES